MNSLAVDKNTIQKYSNSLMYKRWMFVGTLGETIIINLTFIIIIIFIIFIIIMVIIVFIDIIISISVIIFIIIIVSAIALILALAQELLLQFTFIFQREKIHDYTNLLDWTTAYEPKSYIWKTTTNSRSEIRNFYLWLPLSFSTNDPRTLWDKIRRKCFSEPIFPGTYVQRHWVKKYDLSMHSFDICGCEWICVDFSLMCWLVSIKLVTDCTYCVQQACCTMTHSLSLSLSASDIYGCYYLWLRLDSCKCVGMCGYAYVYLCM